MFRFVIACGPTGGHLVPAKLVASQLEKTGNTVRVVSSAAVSNPLINEIKNNYIRLDTEGWQGGVFSRMRCLLKMTGALKYSWSLLKAVDAVISFGGYPAVPVLTAARLKKIPIFIQEQNRLMGRTNRLFASSARCCFWGFEPLSASGTGQDLVTGNPVRRQTPCADDWFTEKPFLLVTGGSQGSREMSQYLEKTANYFIEHGWKIFYVRGKFGLDLCEQFPDETVFRQVDFEQRLPAIIGAADCVWSRCGAGALSELAYYDTPALRFPFAAAADEHQRLNAEYFVRKGPAAIADSFSPRLLFERSLELARSAEGYNLNRCQIKPPEDIITEYIIDWMENNENI
ncbi:MAG: UDP-N-acetylglucosamine--N-acetylmuramyl-(pentapeptide) pyrophosphoryl-undecaprenol N-acetylglucosamine transferase [bacterium]